MLFIAKEPQKHNYSKQTNTSDRKTPFLHQKAARSSEQAAF